MLAQHKLLSDWGRSAGIGTFVLLALDVKPPWHCVVNSKAYFGPPKILGTDSFSDFFLWLWV